MISIKNLNKYYNKGRQNEIHVINDVTLDLPECGMVAIHGKSGCGKTTLLNVIGGLDGFHSGELTIEGKSISENTDDIRNRYVGYIFQNYNLNRNESCFDNIAAALYLSGMTDKAEIAKRVFTALGNVGMENYALRLPDTLSGGQQQRIAIARAIVKNPPIILADEPTGNLDEANTVMIMDLLRSISREHLVLLVTHEETLVDYYCDSAIELSDGKIISIRECGRNNGYDAKDKNAVYLGEFEKKSLSDGNAVVEYYGEAPDTPIKIRIVNSGGRLLLKVDSERVMVIDETSEITLRDGVYEKQEASGEGKALDMSMLPTVKATKTGSLFTFPASLKSGYNAFIKNRKKDKRGRKFLKRIMTLFASVIVFISAIFGTAFKDMSAADSAYNHNVLYLYMRDDKTNAVIKEALTSPDSAVDYVRLQRGYPTGDTTVSFRAGSFETFSKYDMSSFLNTNAVMLDESLAGGYKLLCGKGAGLSDTELIITSQVAESLLEKSTLGYIEEERDLLGLVLSGFSLNGSAIRIAGIVEAEESAVYFNSRTLAKYVMSSLRRSKVALASDYGITLDEGETLLAVRAESVYNYPYKNAKITIQGKPLTVTEIKVAHSDYAKWLESVGKTKMTQTSYFSERIFERLPEINQSSLAFKSELEKEIDKGLFEYYDYYYSDLDEFYENILFFDSGVYEVWLYLEKGIEDMKYFLLPEDYYKAYQYKNEYGYYPTVSILKGIEQKYPNIYEFFKEVNEKYSDEFYASNSFTSIYETTYLVSDADYVDFSRLLGKTHESAEVIKNNYFEDEIEISYDALYTLIHSTDPQKTEKWLRERLTNLEITEEGRLPLITPDDIYESLYVKSSSKIGRNLVAFVIMVAVMCASVYFIMHASVMNRIREIGIYRAIGVSRKNLAFRFFIEAATLTFCTVLVGYLVSSLIIGILCSGSALMTSIFYYPLWLALLVLITVCSVTLFFGVLPILLLLRKTPSAILAKYDI